jgi:hypothetical protein
MLTVEASPMTTETPPTGPYADPLKFHHPSVRPAVYPGQLVVSTHLEGQLRSMQKPIPCQNLF